MDFNAGCKITDGYENSLECIIKNINKSIGLETIFDLSLFCLGNIFLKK